MSERLKNEIAGIDYLRLCAAVLVMAYHFLFYNRLVPGNHHFDALRSEDGLDTFFGFGWIGVELFFVISGYVIAYSAEGRTTLSFLKGRILRLMPAIWVCATIEFALLMYMGDSGAAELSKSWIRTIFLWPRGQINGVYWTLQIEVCFYSIVIILMRAGLRKMLEPMLFVVGLCSGAFWLTEMQTSGAMHAMLESRGNGVVFRGILLTHGCFFATGISLYKGFALKFTPYRLLSLVLLSICCCVEIAAHHRWLVTDVNVQLSVWAPEVAFIIGYAAVVLSIFYNDRISRIIGPRGLLLTRIAGRMTFPLYLIHQAIGGVVVYAFASRYGLATVPLAMILALTAAFLIDRYPEKWVRHALKATIQRSPTSETVSFEREDQSRAQTLLRRAR